MTILEVVLESGKGRKAERTMAILTRTETMGTEAKIEANTMTRSHLTIQTNTAQNVNEWGTTSSYADSMQKNNKRKSTEITMATTTTGLLDLTLSLINRISFHLIRILQTRSITLSMSQDSSMLIPLRSRLQQEIQIGWSTLLPTHTLLRSKQISVSLSKAQLEKSKDLVVL